MFEHVESPPEKQEDRIGVLLREDIELSKENNKILRRMERNALIGFFAKVFIWLLLLGVPLFFLGPYLKPLFNTLTGSPTESSGLPVGIPGEKQLQELFNAYSGN